MPGLQVNLRIVDHAADRPLFARGIIAIEEQPFAIIVAIPVLLLYAQGSPILRDDLLAVNGESG
jgi:hypothetical protein